MIDLSLYRCKHCGSSLEIDLEYHQNNGDILGYLKANGLEVYCTNEACGVCDTLSEIGVTDAVHKEVTNSVNCGAGLLQDALIAAAGAITDKDVKISSITYAEILGLACKHPEAEVAAFYREVLSGLSR